MLHWFSHALAPHTSAEPIPPNFRLCVPMGGPDAYVGLMNPAL